jgi:hypothetical protein
MRYRLLKTDTTGCEGCALYNEAIKGKCDNVVLRLPSCLFQNPESGINGLGKYYWKYFKYYDLPSRVKTI